METLPPTDSLKARIAKARAGSTPETGSITKDISATSRSLAYAMRLGIEFVAGASVGGVGGYLLDEWLDTSPWIMILGFFLGVAAGFKNMIKASQRLDTVADSATTQAHSITPHKESPDSERGTRP